MKKNKWIVILILLAALMLPQAGALAAPADEVQLETEGEDRVTVTLNMPEAAAEEVSSIQLSLRIEAETEIGYSFVFAGELAKVQEYRTDGDGVLTVYVAGTEPLFDADGTLMLGEVVFEDSAAAAGVKVSLVENSVQYVADAELTPAAISALPEVSFRSGEDPVQPSDPVSPQESEGESEGESEEESEPVPQNPEQEPQNPERALSAETRAQLQTMLETAKGFDSGKYTEESYREVEALIREAEALLADAAAGETRGQDILRRLQAAAANLQTVNQDVPTGDNTVIVPLIIAAAVALAVIAGIIILRRKMLK